MNSSSNFPKVPKKERRPYTMSEEAKKSKAENFALFQLLSAKGNVPHVLYEIETTHMIQGITDREMSRKRYHLTSLRNSLKSLLAQAEFLVRDIQSHRISQNNQSKKG